MYDGIIKWVKKKHDPHKTGLVGAPICFNFITPGFKPELNGLCGLYGHIMKISLIDGDGSGPFMADLAIATHLEGFYSVHRDLKLVYMTGEDGQSVHPDGVLALCLAEEYEEVKKILDEMHGLS